MTIKWLDEEKEGIIIQNTRDFEEALRLDQPHSANGGEDAPLRVVVARTNMSLGVRFSQPIRALLRSFDSPTGHRSPPVALSRRLRSGFRSPENRQKDDLRNGLSESMGRWQAAVMKGIFAVPLLSLILLPCLFFGIPVAFPYIVMKLAKDRQSWIGMALALFIYPFGPIIEFILVTLLLVLIPLWIPVGSFLFGTSAGIGLTFLLAASTNGAGILVMPLLVTASAGLWFGIGIGLSFLLIITLIPVSSLLAPLWFPLCCVAWYLLIPALYFDLVEEAGWAEFITFVW
eukprot:CAMPEP_0114488318 /NCGR_PEP_ID=MMETSP0109-20121206/1258_1 /TAXON_ID=29199 /ORGANISM="Chlorarachnion reptans, Strain CCCM449" /LENGTH=287 /DNA_ID=CAMNT_0001664687 /DNA_START=212 /DNA_END=1072 /DNA_ORIENTATION=+